MSCCTHTYCALRGAAHIVKDFLKGAYMPVVACTRCQAMLPLKLIFALSQKASMPDMLFSRNARTLKPHCRVVSFRQSAPSVHVLNLEYLSKY